MISYLENMKWAEILENKTAEQCWESLKEKERERLCGVHTACKY